MPDARRTVARWRRLGQMLPRDVRERIFEPAFYDVTRSWLRSQHGGGGMPLGAAVLWTALRCVPIALPRFFIDRGKLTRLGRVTITVAAIGASALFVILVVLRPYLGYD